MTEPTRGISRKPLLQALAGERTDTPPVWLMRQAGRYLAEYRETRTRAGSFLELCYTPELAVEVTLQPLRRYPLDAAILFSDILVVPDALGAEVGFVTGEGPRLRPLENEADLDGLSLDGFLDHLAPVFEAVRGIAGALPPEVALIGFAGAPWTLAAYMVEGGGSKDYARSREMARRRPDLFARLIDLLSEGIIQLLEAQIRAGAEVVQIFDSWANVLPPDERQRWCIEPLTHIVSELRRRAPATPIIAFPRAIGPAYVEFAETAAPDGLGIDTSLDPQWAARALPVDLVPCLQGNLDPVALVAGGDCMLCAADHIVEAWRERPFIFNLGHGILPVTPPENVDVLLRHLKSIEG